MSRYGIAGVECPNCSSIHTRVRITGRTDEGVRMRRRKCQDCDAPSFVTIEVPVEATWGELDTEYRLKQREYARRREGYHGLSQHAGRTRNPARLRVTIKVLRGRAAA